MVWKEYRRNHKGSIPPKKTRKMCIVSSFIYSNMIRFNLIFILVFREMILLLRETHVRFVVMNTWYSTTEILIYSNNFCVHIQENYYLTSM